MTLPIVAIDKLAFGGNGVCRIDGKVCFVPLSCPGDEVSLKITSHKKSFCTASISEIVTGSPLRVVPECPFFGSCGGCNWQHLSYSTQLESKRNILAEILLRGARVPDDLIESVVAAPQQYGYRNRLQFKVSTNNDKLQIGFFRRASHQVEELTGGCPIAVPVINMVLDRFKIILKSFPAIKSIFQMSIDAGDSGVIVILHHTGKITSKHRRYLIEYAGDYGMCTGLFIKADDQSECEKLWGSSEINYLMTMPEMGQKPLVLTYPPGGFSQVNQLQNIAMLTVIRRLCGFTASERLLDLYCGNGNFSLPLASQVASVVGIECNADSIRSAEQNKELNMVANIQFICDDVKNGVSCLVDQGLTFDTVLLDPPRAGAAEAITGIYNLKPNKIIYVSCDPGTLARDCGLLSALGYSVVTSVPIDMFPQTHHIESVTLLERS